MDEFNNGQQQRQPKLWIIAEKIPAEIQENLKDFQPLMRQLLYNRGITTMEEAIAFIDGTMTSTEDPFSIKDMCLAVELLHQAIQNGMKIAVYGDYDADGVTSSALIYEFFSRLGVSVRVYIPNRFDEGYGLNLEAINYLAEEGMELVITVDCGIRSIYEVQHAKSLGLKMIVTDHHLPGEELPPADAIINPRQVGDNYPYKMMAGVGLAYKLVQGYLSKYPQDNIKAEDWLDLVAIGTVADLAPLTGENRKMVKNGLKSIQERPRQGLFAMSQVAGMNVSKINASNIGFTIAPRLNAAGRMDSAMASFDLLVTRDIFDAGMLAQKLDVQNTQRQALTREILARALEIAQAKDPLAPFIFAASEDFSEGVVGLAASRIVDAYYKPAIVGHVDGQYTVASCRSIEEWNITDALDKCADLLVRHGGHSAAAGFTVENEKVPSLLERLDQHARTTLANLELAPKLLIDREVQLDKLDYHYLPQILDDLKKLEPTGRENPEALFCSYACLPTQQRVVGNDGSHLKLKIRAGNYEFDAIAFKQGYWYANMPEKIDIVYTFEVNVFNGKETVQLNIKDIKPSRDL